MKTVNCSLAACIVLAFASLTAAAQNTTFSLVRSAGATNANCIADARGRVTINSLGNVDVMHVEVSEDRVRCLHSSIAEFSLWLGLVSGRSHD